MRAEGILQAEERLKRARSAFAEVKAASQGWKWELVENTSDESPVTTEGFGPGDFEVEKAEVAWKDFLVSAAGVYAKLKQGAFGHGPSWAWFSQVELERKNDELLQYLHHARNSDEHTLRVSSEPFYQPTVTSAHPAARVDGSEIHIPASLPPGTTFAIFHPPGLRLLPVIDRGVTYNVPKQHLEKPIEGSLPSVAGEAALKYLDDLIVVASTFVIPSPPASSR